MSDFACVDPGGAGASDVRSTEFYRGVFTGSGTQAVIHIASFAITGNPPTGDWTHILLVYSWNGGGQTTIGLSAESTASPGSFNGNMCWNAGGLTRCTGTEGGSPATTPVAIGKPSAGPPDTLRIFGISATSPTGPTQFEVTIGDVIDTNTGLPVPNEIVPPGPEPGVRFDWDDDGFDVGDYDDCTTDTMSWTITRGASAEITGSANPGSATILLRRTNRDGRYNPRLTTGPLYGKLRDGIRTHIAVNNDGTVSGAGTVRGLFAGRVTDISVLQDAGPDNAVITEFVCEDPLAWYGRTPAHVNDSRTRSHRELRLDILGSIGESHYSLDSEIGTMPLSSADGDAFAVLTEINRANGTRHFAKPADAFSDWYAYTTYNRQHKLAGVSDASIDAASDHATETSGWRTSADTVTNQQTANVTPIGFPLGVQKVWESDEVPFHTRRATHKIWAEFSDYVDGATVSMSHTGSATVSVQSFGRRALIEIVAASVVEITDLQVFGRPVIRGPVASYTADDTTSQAAPRGIRAGSDLSGDYLGVLAMGEGIANHVVWRYGSPQLRPTLTVVNWFPYQFELDLFDVIDITSTHFAADAVLFEIVGLTHNGIIASSGPKLHTTTYVLQECRVQAPKSWFTLGTSHLDPGTDVLAY